MKGTQVKELYNNNGVVIFDFCRTSLPCMHNVVIDNEPDFIDGVTIYNLFKSRNLEVPKHFHYCEELIKERISKKKLDEIMKSCFDNLNSLISNFDNIVELLKVAKNNEHLFVGKLMQYGSIDMIKYFVDNKPEMFKDSDEKIVNILFGKNIKNESRYGTNNIYYGTKSDLEQAAQYGNNSIVVVLLEKYNKDNHKFDDKEFVLFCDKKLLDAVKYMLENKMLINESKTILEAKLKVKKTDLEMLEYLTKYELSQQKPVISNAKLVNMARYRNFK
jgi:hypothetical protein